MKKAITKFLFLLIPLIHFGQNAYTDSLLNLYNQSNDDSARIMLLCMISDDHSLSRADSAMYYAQAALTLANEKDFKKGQARSLTRIGNLLKSNGEFAKAFEIHLSSLKLSEEINDLIGLAASNSNIAEILKEQETFSQALQYYWKANKSFENVIARLETAQPRNEGSIFYNTRYLAITFLNIGDCYERMKRYDSALFFQQKAHDISVRIDDQEYIGAILNNLGSIYAKQEQPEKALLYYRNAIPYLISIQDKQFLSNVFHGISEIFLKTARPDSAVHYARNALSSAQEGEFTKEVYNAQLLLSNVFEKLKNTDSAFFYQKLAISTKDTLFNLEKANKVQALNNSEQFRQVELAAAKAKAEKERKDNLQMIAITLFIITFFAVVVILGRQKKKHKLVEYLGIIGLLLLFEFIALFLHPYIANWTHHTPVFMLIILVGVAAILTPLHHQLTHWIKNKLLHGNKHPVVEQQNETKETDPKLVIKNNGENKAEDPVKAPKK